jgi:uncharacterized protein YdaU (DUF1376 family)
MSPQFSGPWIPWFHGDFLKSTQGWTVTERGMYFLLLGASWEMGPLPDDRRRLAGIVGAQLDEFDEAWKVVGPKFENTGKGLINRRLEQHREKQAIRSEKARMSAMNRWNGASQCESDANAHANADANALESHSKSDANSMLGGMRSGCSSELRTQNSEKDKNLKTPRANARAVPALHQEVIEAFHETCPDLPHVKIWTQKRRQALDARIAERMTAGKPADSVDYWRSVFQQVASSDFLCGRTKEPFSASLEWLLLPNNFAKVIEGNYANRKANGVAHG